MPTRGLLQALLPTVRVGRIQGRLLCQAVEYDDLALEGGRERALGNRTTSTGQPDNCFRQESEGST